MIWFLVPRAEGGHQRIPVRGDKLRCASNLTTGTSVGRELKSGKTSSQTSAESRAVMVSWTRVPDGIQDVQFLAVRQHLIQLCICSLRLDPRTWCGCWLNGHQSPRTHQSAGTIQQIHAKERCLRRCLRSYTSLTQVHEGEGNFLPWDNLFRW